MNSVQDRNSVIGIIGRVATDSQRSLINVRGQVHNLSEAEFLVDGMGYPTALAQTDLGGHLDYVTRN
jgi:putative transposase